MMPMKILLTGLLACTLLLAFGQAPSPTGQKAGEWILMTEPGSFRTDQLHARGLPVVRPLAEEAGAFLLAFSQSEEDAVHKALDALPGFLALQPNYYLESRSVTPNDPFFDSQWSLLRIQAPEAWAFTTGGQTALGDTIVVAVMDDGFDLEHPDLIDNLWVNRAELEGLPGVDDDMNGYPDDVQGWNFDDTTPILPIRSHGTSVLGILGASGDNGAGLTGINWHIRILPMSVRTIGDMIEAYAYVYQLRKRYNDTGGAEGVCIAAPNASLGFSKVFCTEFPALHDILDSLGQEGVLNAAATANGDWDVDEVGDIPTSCASEFLIAVTNADIRDEKIPTAAYGAAAIDLAAPGGDPLEGILTTDAPGAYKENFGGTSAACPHVAGAIALLHALPSEELARLIREQPAESARLIKEAILEGADSLQAFQGITLSGGRLNLYRSALYLHGAFQPIELDDPGQYADRRRMIRVYPNPLFSGEPIQIVYGSRNLEPVTVRLFNALGQQLQQISLGPEAFGSQFIELPTANLAAGTYWVVLENGISPIAEKVIIY